MGVWVGPVMGFGVKRRKILGKFLGRPAFYGPQGVLRRTGKGGGGTPRVLKKPEPKHHSVLTTRLIFSGPAAGWEGDSPAHAFGLQRGLAASVRGHP